MSESFLPILPIKTKKIYMYIKLQLDSIWYIPITENVRPYTGCPVLKNHFSNELEQQVTLYYTMTWYLKLSSSMSAMSALNLDSTEYPWSSQQKSWNLDLVMNMDTLFFTYIDLLTTRLVIPLNIGCFCWLDTLQLIRFHIPYTICNRT